MACSTPLGTGIGPLLPSCSHTASSCTECLHRIFTACGRLRGVCRPRLRHELDRVQGGACSAVREIIGPSNSSISLKQTDPDSLAVDDIELLEWMLQHGADPNVKNGRGVTPLATAVVMDRPTAAQLLLDHGAAVEPHLIHRALDATSGTSESMLRLLVGAGVDLNYDSPSHALLCIRRRIPDRRRRWRCSFVWGPIPALLFATRLVRPLRRPSLPNCTATTTAMAC